MNSERLGATLLAEDACRFLVWAPSIEEVRVHIHSPEERFLPLERIARGYHHGTLRGVGPASRYTYSLDGKADRPDPASRFQPEGVHGPSEVVASDFTWEDSHWSGIPLSHYVLYELHVGTFTAQGTFDAIIPHLDDLGELGITAIEIMPVAQFPGMRNWGYDGTYPFAVQNSYGGPPGLKRLVNACHKRGLAVTLDVVYNHLGPEGNYLREFGPYLTDRYRTPWGPAINFDGPGSDEVRRFFVGNALYWVTEFHIDALRIDAVHGIFDFSAIHILQELACAVHGKAEQLSRRVHVIAESDLNDPKLVRPRDVGGYGLDAQWNDDFHHALHALLTAVGTPRAAQFPSTARKDPSLREQSPEDPEHLLQNPPFVLSRFQARKAVEGDPEMSTGTITQPALIKRSWLRFSEYFTANASKMAKYRSVSVRTVSGSPTMASNSPS